MPTTLAQDIVYFKTYSTIKHHLQHIFSKIAANLQHICCSMIFFCKMEVTSYSRIIFFTFPENLVWFYQTMPLKKVFLGLMQVCCSFAAFCSNLGIFWKWVRSGCVQHAKLSQHLHFQQLLHICSLQTLCPQTIQLTSPLTSRPCTSPGIFFNSRLL